MVCVSVWCVCESTQFTVREDCCGVCVCESTQFTVREDCCGVCVCVRALSLPSERTVVVCVSCVCESTQFTV